VAVAALGVHDDQTRWLSKAVRSPQSSMIVVGLTDGGVPGTLQEADTDGTGVAVGSALSVPASQ
jgi:hypothetical protein